VCDLNEKEIRELFCKWCPRDNADLCDERECGCLSVRGFVEELLKEVIDARVNRRRPESYP